MNYYEHHIGDYLKDTAHLSLLEHGVYRRLLDVYYTRESGIPDDQAARLIGARSKEEREALSAVLAEFFSLRDGTHWQGRTDREIERFRRKSGKAKSAANTRWGKCQEDANASSEHDANADASGMRTHSERNATCAPVPSPQSPDTNSEAKLLRVGVAKPRPLRKAPESFLIDASLQQWAREHVPSVDIRIETEKFRDHTFRTAITDWPGAWRNWMRRSGDIAPRGSRAANDSADPFAGAI